MNLVDKVNKIKNCNDCYGKGLTGWVSPDGDYDFEFCDCNPDSIILDSSGEVVA